MAKKRGSKGAMSNFSEDEEKLIRQFLFTDPKAKISFVYPQMLVSSEELSPLMSAYSRTDIPMQRRVLKFLDQNKEDQTRAILPLMPTLIETFRNPDGTLKMSAKTAIFNKQWPLKHGHSSIKEETGLFGHCEDISDITGKKITGHPLNKPQVKSTRYISFAKSLDLSLKDPDLNSLPNSTRDRVLEYVTHMNERYQAVTGELADRVYDHRYTAQVVEFLRRPDNVRRSAIENLRERQEVEEGFEITPKTIEEEESNVLKYLEDKGVRGDVRKFVFDYSRVYLLAATRTSMGFSVDARTLEEIITDLISSPRIEDREKGQKLWNEAKKIAPVLLGESSHVKVDDWKVKNETDRRSYLQEKFGDLPERGPSEGMVDVLHPRNTEMYTDRFNAALIAFQYTGAKLHDIICEMSEKDVREVLEKAHEHRSDFDVLHPAISHGGLVHQITMPYFP